MRTRRTRIKIAFNIHRDMNVEGFCYTRLMFK